MILIFKQKYNSFTKNIIEKILKFFFNYKIDTKNKKKKKKTYLTNKKH